MIPLVLVSTLLLLSPGAMDAERPQNACAAADESAALASESGSSLHLVGLITPAVVSNTIHVNVSPVLSLVSVTYILDDRPLTQTSSPPFRLQRDDHSSGYSLIDLAPGIHCLRAEGKLAEGKILRSKGVTIDILPSIGRQFSPELSAYKNQPSAQSKDIANVMQDTSTPGAQLSGAELATRRAILAMYMNWGIDPSLDRENDESDVLRSLLPRSYTPHRQGQEATPLSLLFSSDAPFYQPIPRSWPRTLLPARYIRQVQLNTNKAGDGIGFGQAVAGPLDPPLTVRSQWYDNRSTLKVFSFAMPSDWATQIPWQASGDRHMIFVDPKTDMFISSYKTSLDKQTGGPDALYASSPTPLDSLGDHGGSIAAHFAELPAMLQPGEATDPTHPIRHALGGAVARVWAARVYPATARDAGVLTSRNTCTGKDVTNTGLVPYGGVIQLDPQLDLTSLGLTLPALRILQAIQTYGYYVEDFGCADLDIYTAVAEEEFAPFGGLWGDNHRGVGVQNEITKVLTHNKLYVVAPLVKKE